MQSDFSDFLPSSLKVKLTSVPSFVPVSSPVFGSNLVIKKDMPDVNRRDMPDVIRKDMPIPRAEILRTHEPT